MSLRNPVKYPVKYYSWQDDQAPQLTNADGVIKTILKACLVTGYGSKAGAGWTALFEDAYRIVLRRPLRTGNPPDIKIENGTITGTTKRHRIVAQDNPIGLDDANELSAVNLLARDQNLKPEWHCIVTDFAFLLCYQMAENNQNGDRNYTMFVGGAKKLLDSDAEYFFATTQSPIGVNGLWTSGFLNGILGATSNFVALRRNKTYTTKNILTLAVTETQINSDYFAQKIIIDAVAELPFFASVSISWDNLTTKTVSINNRQMLRYVNKTAILSNNSNYNFRALYIPLDYWEL